MTTPIQGSSPATAQPMPAMKRTLTPSIMSYPPLFVVSRNTKFKIIGGLKNTQISKNVYNEFGLNNSSNRNGEHLTDFTQIDYHALRQNFRKERENYGPYIYANNAKAQVNLNKKWINCALNYEAYSSFKGRCPLCNGYCRRKWIRRYEFKSWTRMIAFHIALIPLGKVWIQLFSLQLWVNSRAD